jgi:hypothetical protein
VGLLLLAALLASPFAIDQDSRFWREPYVQSPFPVQVVAPPGGMPIDITDASVSPGLNLLFEAHVRMIGVRPYPFDGVTLRMAIGPTPDGMICLRLVPLSIGQRPDVNDARLRANGAVVHFERFYSDAPIPTLAFRKGVHVVVTLDTIRSRAGEVIWTNPDATELVWDALGRPSNRK